MKILRNVFFAGVLFLLASGACSQKQSSQSEEFEIDSLMTVKFDSVPQKTFCQSALGDVTSYKYQTVHLKSNYITEASVYKNIKSDLKNNEDFFSYIVRYEELSALKSNGKIVEAVDTTWNNLPARYFKIIMPGDAQGVVVRNLYIRQKDDKVVKLTTSIQENEVDNISNDFFASLAIK